MSRSYNKFAPAWGNNNRPSDVYFKKLWHKKCRLECKSRIKNESEICIVHKNEVSDKYSSSKDGSPHRVHKSKLKEYLQEEFENDTRKGWFAGNRKKQTSVKYRNRK